MGRGLGGSRLLGEGNCSWQGALGPLRDAGQLAALPQAVSSAQPPAHSDASPGLASDPEDTAVLCFDLFLLCLILITHIHTHKHTHRRPVTRSKK